MIIRGDYSAWLLIGDADITVIGKMTADGDCRRYVWTWFVPRDPTHDELQRLWESGAPDPMEVMRGG